MGLLVIVTLAVVVLAVVGYMMMRVPDPRHRYSEELWEILLEEESSEPQFEMRAAD